MDNRRRDDDIEAEARPDEAVFTIERLERSGRRSIPPVAVAAFAAGVLVVGIAGALTGSAPRMPTAPDEAQRPQRSSPAVADAPGPSGPSGPNGRTEVPPERTASQRLTEGPFGPPDGRTGVTPGGAARPLLTVDAAQSDDIVFVHGDVFTRRASNVVVTVTVVDGRNRTLIVQSVDLPGGSTAFRLGANDRFDLAVVVPASPTAQPATVVANAYDEAGAVIASATKQLPQPDEAPAGR